MFYSQKSYPNTKLGYCSQTIAAVGCFRVSFSNLLILLNIADIAPDKLVNKFYPAGGCMANAAAWAKLYNLDYTKTTVKPTNGVWIFETNYWKAVAPQHFCVMRKDGMILDPLSNPCDWTTNKYKNNIVSYRVFTPKVTPQIQNPVSTPQTTTQNTPKVVQITPEVIQTTPVSIQVPTESIQTEQTSELPSDVILEGSGTTLTAEPENVASETVASPAGIVHDGEPIIPVDPNIQAMNQAEQDLTPWWEKLIQSLINLFLKK